jgi:DNA-binding CsgD family transcriptional regulator
MGTLRPEAFDAVVDGFFEAAALPSLWPGALHALALACGSVGVAAHAADGVRTVGSVFSEGTAGMAEAFVAHWRAPELNSHRSRGLALLDRGWRGAFTERDIFTREEIARDPFHQDFIVRNGYASFAGLVVAKAPGLMFSTSIYRDAKQGHYDSSEIAHINKLAGHLQIAGKAAMRIGMSATRRVTEAFVASGQSVALIGRDGRVVHMSAPFERLVRDGVHVKAGRLGCAHADADRALSRAINRATGYDGTLRDPLVPVILPRRNGLRPLMVEVIPIRGAAQDIFNVVSALAILTDLESTNQRPAEPLLQQAFGLTPAEARLAARLTNGDTLPDIARLDNTPHETLRTRLKSVFDKTGTSRQTELALLVTKFAKGTILDRS